MGSAAQVEEIGSNVSGGGGGGGDEFYEDIEAPKFVDFTAPDHYNPDDGYWFCSRVGKFHQPLKRHEFCQGCFLFKC